MKNNGIIVILCLAIVIMSLISCVFIVKYIQTRDLYINEHKNVEDLAYHSYYREVQNSKEIESLRKELSKYDESYKNIIEVYFKGELKEISEESKKLIVDSVSMNGEYTLMISDETEIVKNGDIMDKSVLEEGQTLKVCFMSEMLEEYPKVLTDIKSIEIE